jgi:hypothetical protein
MTKSFTSYLGAAVVANYLGAAVVAGALAIGLSAYAQDQQNAPAQGAAPRDSHHGMMQGDGMGQGGMGMMKMMGQMDPAEMKRMMENCNKMMEGMQSPPLEPRPEQKG